MLLRFHESESQVKMMGRTERLANGWFATDLLNSNLKVRKSFLPENIPKTPAVSHGR